MAAFHLIIYGRFCVITEATHNLARNVAVSLKRSTLPAPADLVPEQETGKMSK